MPSHLPVSSFIEWILDIVINAHYLHHGNTYLIILSIDGQNKHYGTPTNPLAKDRVPGGSSSGSAVAVAAKLVDFALGETASI